VPVVVCPADGYLNRVTNGMYVGDYKPPVRLSNSTGTNLVGPGGLLASSGVALASPANNAIMQTNVTVKITQVLDGSSNTILLVECAGGTQLYRQGKMFDPNPLKGAAWADRDAVLAPAGFDTTKANATSIADAATRPGLVLINGTNNSEVYAFHTGGANAVFADGHVSFLKSSIAPTTFVALITYQAGDIPGEY